MTKMDWIYIAVVGVFVLGMLIGITLGKRKAMLDMLYQQQRMEATRLWTESISKVMGGQNVGK